MVDIINTQFWHTIIIKVATIKKDEMHRMCSRHAKYGKSVQNFSHCLETLCRGGKIWDWICKRNVFKTADGDSQVLQRIVANTLNLWS
jgi:hypothetical protein